MLNFNFIAKETTYIPEAVHFLSERRHKPLAV